MTEVTIIIISILTISPLLLEVAFYLLVAAAYALDVPDMRLSSIGFTEYLSDCAVAESMKNEEQKKLFINLLILEQEIMAATNEPT